MCNGGRRVEEKNPLPLSEITLNTSISKDLVEVEEKLQIFFSRETGTKGCTRDQALGFAASLVEERCAMWRFRHRLTTRRGLTAQAADPFSV